jgi:mitogen-activated protein kinase 15
MIGEVARGKPLFQGTSTINQLERILSWSGPPSMNDIKSMKVNVNQALLDILHTKRRVNRQ